MNRNPDIDRAQALFDTLGEGVPDRRPATGDLLAAGRVARRRRRRRTLAGVVAATVAAIGTGIVVQQVVSSPAALAPAGPNPSTGIDIQPGRWPLPSVLGYDEEQARARLEQLGLVVSVEPTGFTGCGVESGDALGTEPSTTTVVGPGDAVMLRVAGPDGNSSGVIDCVDDNNPPLALLKLARGGRAPAFAPNITVVTPAGTSTLSAAVAADPVAWTVCDSQVCRNPLDALVARADRPLYGGSQHPTASPYLRSFTSQVGSSSCRRSLDEDRAPLVVDVEFPYDGPESSCGVLDIYLDDQGLIYAVELVPQGTERPTTDMVRDVRGMQVGPAREELAFAAFGATIVSVGPCPLGDVVHDQAPLNQAPPGSHVNLTVCDPTAN